jgi:streptogrisin C
MRRNHLRGRIKALLAAGCLSVTMIFAGTGAAVADGQQTPLESIAPGTGQAIDLENLVADTVDDLGETLTGGVYVDRDGSVVVTVTSPDADVSLGSRPTVVRRVGSSLHELEAVHASLDRYARQHSVGDAQTWHIDIPSNKVVITTSTGATDPRTRAFLRYARNRGPAITVERVDARVRPASWNLYNSDTFDLTNSQACSVGFNAVDGQHRPIFVTAGHCLVGSPAAYRGSYVGSTAGYRYPSSDFGAIRTDTSTWEPVPAVNKYDGQARAVIGTVRPPVGTTVCKSSAVSGWSCGVIQAYDQTVNYGNGNLVYGLVRFNACVEPGDSGGAVMYGSYAAGVISGAQFYDSASGTERCGQRVGRPNVSFYQPIRPALRGLGASLLTYSNPRN